eukprot:scaffold75098_cov16-Prasinocladus_malaysianus.AAC.1
MIGCISIAPSHSPARRIADDRSRYLSCMRAAIPWPSVSSDEHTQIILEAFMLHTIVIYDGSPLSLVATVQFAAIG